MAQEEIEIEIDAQGKVTVRTKGIKGPGCLKVAELFAQIIGREKSRQLTSEYYENSTEVQHHNQVKQRRS